MNITKTLLGIALCSTLLAPAAALADSMAAGAPRPGALTALDSMGPMTVSGISVENFGVVDGRIYRGAQPKGDDFRALAAFGIRTIVDLRLDARSKSRAEAEAAGLRYVNIPIKGTGGKPTDAQAAAFLMVIDDPASGPVYVHCAGGRHRTGSLIAVYRMAHQGWTIGQAYDEMLKYDFYTRNGHKGFKEYVEEFSARLTATPEATLAGVHAPHTQTVVAAAKQVGAR